MTDDSKRAAAESFVDTAFRDRIAWVAARLILVGVTQDAGYAELTEGTRARVERFLRSHPRDHEEAPDGG